MLLEKGKELPRDQAQQDYATVIALALGKSVGGSHHASKMLMRWTGACERTTKNWLSGDHGPSGQHLIALAQHSPEVRNAIEVLVGHPCVGGNDRLQRALELLTTAVALLRDFAR